MSWAVGFDPKWNRDIGYGVPTVCDFPGCGEKIDRGLANVCCDEQPFGGEDGCGLYFCGKHPQQCERCKAGKPPFDPTPDIPEWLNWKLTDGSWAEWRRVNPGEVERIKALVGGAAVLPLSGKPTRRGLRRASRGLSRGRRATHRVETAYGRHQRQQEHNAYWAVLYGARRQQEVA
jgi:hypothetical protein